MSKILVYGFALLHGLLILTNLTIAIFIPFFHDLMLAIPISTIIIIWLLATIFGSMECPLSIAENKLRQSVGMKEIDGFYNYYVFRGRLR